MKSKKIIVAFLCATLMLANGSLMAAQEKQQSQKTVEIRLDAGEGGSFAWASGESQQMVFVQEAGERAAFEFAISEMVTGKPVKGAPYSAEAVTESIQMLADGNRIVRRNSAQVYRDSEGRTRRDQAFTWTNKSSQNTEAIRTSFIDDPVSGVSYTLHHNDKTALKVMARRIRIAGPPEEKARAEAKAGEAKARHEGPSEDHMKMRGPMRRPGLGMGPEVHAEVMAMGSDIRIALDGPGSFARKDAKKESLGTQMIEGVQAEGTRATVTIPAGEIGNEQPINIVSERWYSPELQVVVMSRHSDPRMGETTYRLTNINRTEPAKSLFEIPSDYSLQEPRGPREFRKGREM